MKPRLSQKDWRKIVKKIQEGEPFVGIPLENGRLVVWGLEEYLAKKEVTKRHKPWPQRKKKSLFGPIGSKPLGLISQDLSRAAIYGER